MKKILYCLLLFVMYTAAKAERGDIVNVELKQSQTASEVEAFLLAQISGALGGVSLPPAALSISYAVDLYKVAYETVDFDGITPITATGILVVPTNHPNPSSMPILSYGHGLCLKHDCVPSSDGNIYRELVKGLAANGYIAVAPDYIHLGVDATAGFQAFMHAASEVTATIDLLRAARTYLASQTIAHSDELYVSGYSQGGHSSMAVCKAIQEEYYDEFAISAAMPGGGTYDLSGIACDSLAVPDRITGEPHAFCLIVASYLEVYADSMEVLGYYGLEDIFAPEYLEEILNELNPNGGSGTLLPTPNQMLLPDVREAFLNDPNHFIRRFLSYNDLYDWAPQMPMRIFHTTADVENPYPNVTFTYNNFLALGSTSVELDTITGHDHGTAGLFHALALKNWLNGLTVNSPTLLPNPAVITVYPNPFSNNLFIDITTKDNNKISTINIYNTAQQLMYTQAIMPNNEEQIVVQLPTTLNKGLYIAQVISDNGTHAFKIVKQ